MTVEYLSTGGNTLNTWVCPANVFEITVECIGGGSVSASRSSNGANGGGGGGAWARKSNFAVTPGATYYWWTGTGSNALTGQAVRGAVFQTSATVDAGIVCRGARGENGTNNNSSGRLGGQASNCIGDEAYSGGNGADGVAGSYGGGGGAAASSAGPGSSASGITGAAGAGDGGSGADGRTAEGVGLTGSVYGGGGSGALRLTSGVRLDGAPGAGLVKLTYTRRLALVLQTSGEIIVTAAPAGGAKLLYVNDGIVVARTAAVTGDRLLILEAGQVLTGPQTP